MQLETNPGQVGTLEQLNHTLFDSTPPSYLREWFLGLIPLAKNSYSRVLTDVEDLKIFVDNYNQGSKKRKVEDLSGSFVRAFYINQKMVGGYSLNERPPFFHIEMIPSDEMEKIDLLTKNKKFTEIRSLWIRSETSNVLRAKIYSQSVLDAIKTRPDFILGGTFTERYRKTQMRALPRLIYHGKVSVWNKKQVWWIFCGKPQECLIRLPYAVAGGWSSRLIRILKSR